ncbi:MAG: DegT/DnrJ/EryC1/StrS family aminotransferase [bacterium]|nr:DegT/DnrJ/EryC1/StrS family aminotransferase [bacterium]
MSIPLLDLKAQYASIREEINEAVLKVIESGCYILGPNVAALEEEVAAYCQASFGIGVASGTDALYISLLAIGIKPGDEVITVPFTFIATAEVITLLGAKPVFVDIDPLTFNINPDRIEAAVTKKTKAIIPVHLYGQPADLDPILSLAAKYDLKVIEDGAQAIGAEYKGKRIGAIGDLGALSFFPAKNLGAYGDGGMVVTNNEDLAELIKMLRVHGSKEKYYHSIIGFNARLDELQAAVLRVKLKYLAEWTEARRQKAAAYNQGLKDSSVVIPQEPLFARHVYNQYTIRSRRRDELKEDLAANGIPTAIHYPMPLHLQEAFAFLGYKKGDFPESERAAGEVLSLPIYPELSEQQASEIIKGVSGF